MDTVNILACTIPDWPLLVKTCESMFGSSPTRELDRKGIKVGDPASYAMVVENINNNSNAVGNLRYANLSLDCIHLTVSIHFDDMDKAAYLFRLTRTVKLLSGPKVLMIGALREFKDLIELNDDVCLGALNSLYQQLCILGFKTLFGNKKGNLDGSFKLIM